MKDTKAPSWVHHKIITRVRDWYGKFERPVSLLFLLGGFAFNVFTLTRVDRFIENFWVGMHLLIVAVCIVLINRAENEGTDAVANAADPSKLHFWLVNVLQFFFGGLLSTFIVFYVRGSVIAVAWPFFIILLVAFIANESFKKHYARTDFQISFFFLSTYLFLIFFVPVILHTIGPVVFLISGAFSIVILLLFILILKKYTQEGFRKGKEALYTSIISIYIVVNAFYFFHIIPPLPLSLQDSGIYHSVARQTNNTYTVTTEDETFIDKLLEYISLYPTYHTVKNVAAYAYSAVYSPGSFDTTIIHEWQRYDEAAKKWTTLSKVTLSVIGGRDEGYRTYSTNSALTNGKWRVNVTTQNGQLIGRMTFMVVVQDTAPAVVIESKE